METYRNDIVFDFTLILINGEKNLSRTHLVTRFVFVVKTKVYNVLLLFVWTGITYSYYNIMYKIINILYGASWKR